MDKGTPREHLKATWVNSLRPRQNRRHFPDDIFKWIFVNENVWILIKISLKFVSKGLINHIPALVQLMAWRQPGDKPLSEPMMVSLLTHICVTQPRWVKLISMMVQVHHHNKAFCIKCPVHALIAKFKDDNSITFDGKMIIGNWHASKNIGDWHIRYKSF